MSSASDGRAAVSRQSGPLAIRAVILDLGNVVVPYDHGRACRAAARRSPLAADDILRRLWGSGLVNRFDGGRIGPRAFFAEVRRIIDYRGTLADLRRCWVEIFRPNPAMERLVRQLVERYRLALLSNTNRPHFEYVRRRFPIVRTFRRRVLSYEVGLLKPDPAIYRLAVKKTGCVPAECVYVDDHPVLAGAAEAVGMTGLVFRGASRLRADLKRLGAAVDGG